MSEWFRDKRIFITGATGLIGSAVVEELLAMNEAEKLGLTVLAGGRDEARFEKRFGKRNGLEFVKYDATQPLNLGCDTDLIIHAASPASPDLFVTKPVETMMANIFGVNEVLKYAAAHKGTKVVYVSSSEVYGKMTPRENGFKEEDSGYVDILSPRSSYPMGKRAAETLCASYVAEYGVDVSIVRPGHIYGPGASESDKRVSSMWPRIAARGEDIVMKSAGTQVRSYTYASDCANAILKVAERGKSGGVYNIANPAVKCSVKDFAKAVAKVTNVHLKFEIAQDCEKNAFNPMDASTLDASKLIALGWKPKYDVKTGVNAMILELKTK